MIYHHRNYLESVNRQKKKEALAQAYEVDYQSEQDHVQAQTDHPLRRLNKKSQQHLYLTDIDAIQKAKELKEQQENAGGEELRQEIDVSEKPTEDQNQPQEQEQAQTDHSERLNPNLRTQSMGTIRKRRFVPNDAKNEPWKKKKRGPQFMLDFRREKPELEAKHPELKNMDSLERLRYFYQRQKNPQPHRATFFIPTLKPKKNPQMQKLEAYFVKAFNSGRLPT